VRKYDTSGVPLGERVISRSTATAMLLLLIDAKRIQKFRAGYSRPFLFAWGWTKQGDVNHLYGNELEKEICFIFEFLSLSFSFPLLQKLRHFETQPHTLRKIVAERCKLETFSMPVKANFQVSLVFYYVSYNRKYDVIMLLHFSEILMPGSNVKTA
jgi:hypothetical protein